MATALVRTMAARTAAKQWIDLLVMTPSPPRRARGVYEKSPRVVNGAPLTLSSEGTRVRSGESLGERSESHVDKSDRHVIPRPLCRCLPASRLHRCPGRRQPAASTIAAKDSATSEAPPASAPSTPGTLRTVRALSAVTDPP